MNTRRSLRILLHVCLCILCSSTLFAASFSGKVIGISDGDTITVLQGKTQVKVRLHGIDAPESHQDFGTQAKKTCSGLAFGRVVSVEVITKDRYGRTVGVVTLPGGMNLNQEMVKRGMAWWYREYAKGSKMLPKLETEALQAGRGLWSHPNPVPPWEFRKGEQAKRQEKAQNHAGSVTQPDGGSPDKSSGDSVYITKTGRRYHRAGCQGLARSQIPITRKEAEKRGYTPCKMCRP